MRVAVSVLLFVVLAAPGLIECKVYRIYDPDICLGGLKAVVPASFVVYVSTLDLLTDQTDVDNVLTSTDRDVFKQVFNKCLKKAFDIEQLPEKWKTFRSEYCGNDNDHIKTFGNCFRENLESDEQARAVFESIDAYVMRSQNSVIGSRMLINGQSAKADKYFRKGSEEGYMSKKHFNAITSFENPKAKELMIDAVRSCRNKDFASSNKYINKLSAQQKQRALRNLDALYQSSDDNN